MHSGEICIQIGHVLLEISQGRIQGRGPRGPDPPLFPKYDVQRGPDPPFFRSQKYFPERNYDSRSCSFLLTRSSLLKCCNNQKLILLYENFGNI